MKSKQMRLAGFSYNLKAAIVSEVIVKAFYGSAYSDDLFKWLLSLQLVKHISSWNLFLNVILKDYNSLPEVFCIS